MAADGVPGIPAQCDSGPADDFQIHGESQAAAKHHDHNGNLAAHIVGYARRGQVIRKQAESRIAETGNGMEDGVPPERVSLQPRNMSPGKIEAYGAQRFHPERDGNNILDEPVYLGNAFFIQQVADGYFGTQAQPLANHQGDEISERHDAESSHLEKHQQNGLSVIGEVFMNIQGDQPRDADGAGADEIGVRGGKDDAVLGSSRRHEKSSSQRNEGNQGKQEKKGGTNAREVEAPVPAGDAEKIFLEVQQRGGSVAEAERAENVLKLYFGDKGGMEKVACQHDQNHQPQPQFYPPGVADGPGKPFFPQNADDARELAQHQEGENFAEIAQGKLVFMNFPEAVPPQQPHQCGQCAQAEPHFHDLKTVQ